MEATEWGKAREGGLDGERDSITMTRRTWV